jgi:hypothetical protein
MLLIVPSLSGAFTVVDVGPTGPATAATGPAAAATGPAAAATGAVADNAVANRAFERPFSERSQNAEQSPIAGSPSSAGGRLNDGKPVESGMGNAAKNRGV